MATEVEWVVNDNAELGVKIGDRFFFLYKGRSLVYGASPETAKDGFAAHDNGTPMRWRPVHKREFGECARPEGMNDLRDEALAAWIARDDWHPLPAPAPLDGKGEEGAK
jgi:hypothetical protein